MSVCLHGGVGGGGDGYYGYFLEQQIPVSKKSGQSLTILYKFPFKGNNKRNCSSPSAALLQLRELLILSTCTVWLFSKVSHSLYLMRISKEVRMVQNTVCGATNTHSTHIPKLLETSPAPIPHPFSKIHRLHLQVKGKTQCQNEYEESN